MDDYRMQLVCDKLCELDRGKTRWYADRSEHYRDDQNKWDLRHPTSHLHFGLHVKQIWNKPGRLEISPDYTINKALNHKSRPSKGYSSITVARGREPMAIARDIAKRLFPDAYTYLNEWKEMSKAWAGYEAGVAMNALNVASWSGNTLREWHNRSDTQAVLTNAGKDRSLSKPYVKVVVSTSDYKVEFDSLTTDQAVVLIKLAGHWLRKGDDDGS